MDRIYFDNAATTAMDPRVIDHMSQAMRELWGNPSSIYQEGRTARAAVEQARKTVANILQASIGEIFFTSGGTESNNMTLKCSVRDLGVKRIISSATEHHAVLHTAERLKKQGMIALDMVRQNEKGEVDFSHLEELLAQERGTTLVSLMYVNNEIGTLTDIKRVGEMCREYGAYFHSDTVQSIGYYPIDLSETYIHFITGSGHKFHGPKGVGFIYINSEAMLEPFIDGGSQERNMRGGTENVSGILGIAKALELAKQEMTERKNTISELREYFASRLREEIPGVEFNGNPFENGHYKILSVSFPPSEKNDLLLLNLDIEGISASGGSACSSGADAGSHVMAALHPGSERATVRFSFSHHNTRSEVDFVIDKLKKTLG